MAGEPKAAPSPSREDFGQYLADHQADLASFFSKNAEDFFKLAVPMLMGMTGWLIFVTMLVGWAVDVLLSRGFSSLFAPAFAEIKRALIYATGRLVLSFVYTALLSLAIIFSLKFAYAGTAVALAVILLVAVALAAQVVWILFLYRTNLSSAALFYLVIMAVHTVICLALAKPILGLRGSETVTAFVDGAITPKLRAEADSTRRELAVAAAARETAQMKVANLQNQVAQSRSDQDQLRQEIEEKKASDLYVLSRILQARARGDLSSARDQLVAFSAKYPTSPLNAVAGTQLIAVNDQLATDQAQKKKLAEEAALTVAGTRADLLARAARGEVTLSQMRQVLIGKSRVEVSDLLGLPSETASDTWGYRQQMILNPMTNEKTGLMVYFLQGAVQGVDYNRNAP